MNLDTRLQNNWKERGDILTKLWKTYFKEVNDSHRIQLEHKNNNIILLLKNIAQLKSRLDNKNANILEKEAHTLELIEINTQLQEMLDESKRIYRAQKIQLEDEKEIKKEIKDKFHFWLPGFEFYSENKSLKDKLEGVNPHREYDEYTQDMEDSKFVLFGDANRLLASVSTKSEYEYKYQKAQELIDGLDWEISQLK